MSNAVSQTWLHSTVMMNIACERELCSFMFVALQKHDRKHRCISVKTQTQPHTWSQSFHSHCQVHHHNHLHKTENI